MIGGVLSLSSLIRLALLVSCETITTFCVMSLTPDPGFPMHIMAGFWVIDFASASNGVGNVAENKCVILV